MMMMMNLGTVTAIITVLLMLCNNPAAAATAQPPQQAQREDPFARWRSQPQRQQQQQQLQQRQPQRPNPTEHSRRRLQEATTTGTTGATTATTDDRLAETSGAALYDVTKIQHVPPPAPHTGRKTVLVTGAAGFVGSHTADALLRRGDRVICLDEVNDYYNVSLKESNLQLLEEIGREKGQHFGSSSNSNVVIYRGDVANATLVEHIFQTERIDWVVHLAARAGVRPSIQNPFVYVHSNLKGTATLLEMATKFGVKNFVQASSSSVYGGSKSTLFDEHENVDFPISPYAASKRSVEFLGMYYARRFQLPITSLRFFTVYGPRGRPDMAPFLFIDWMARGQTIRQFGDGSSSRDYTFIDDIVQGVVGALDRPSPESIGYYQNVNLGKGSGTSLKDFVQLVAKYVEKEPHIQVLPDQPGDVPYTCANVTVAHTMLDYTPTIPFETGIERTVEWYKSVYPYKKGKSKKTNGGSAKALDNGSSGMNKKADDEVLDSDDEDFVQTDRNHRRLQGISMGNSHSKRKRSNLRHLQVVQPHKETKKVLVFAQQESAMLTEHVVNSLVARGDLVTVIVPAPTMHVALSADEYEFSDGVSTHTGCVDNSTFVEGVIKQERPQWIAYLNTLSNVTESKQDPYSYIDVNVQSFVRLLQILKSLDEQDAIENMVIASTSEIYEQTTHVWHAESDSIDTVSSPFAATSKSRELMAHTWHALYRIPVTALRLPRWYGPGECPWCHDDGTDDDREGFWEYMFVSDVSEGIIRSLDRPYPYQIINLGQGPDYVEEACQSRSGLKAMVQAELQGEFFATARAIPCALAKADKAQTLLGFSPQVRLRDGVRRMAKWFRQNPQDMPEEWQDLETASSSYPTLPWSSTDPSEAEAEQAGLPMWVQSIFQIQWILVACFLLYKGATWGQSSADTPPRKST